MAEDCGAEPLCLQLVPDQGRAAPTPAAAPDATALWEAGRRVAGLAALGHTNREISKKRHITTSTVEHHLTKAYRELNASQRKDLPADLRDEAASTA